jgi:two-component system, NtrC family, sensor kinase
MKLKLVPKFTITFILAASVLLAAGGVLRVRREVSIAEQNIIRDHQMLARAVAASMAAVVRNEGEGGAEELVEDAARGAHVTIRWVCHGGRRAQVIACEELGGQRGSEARSLSVVSEVGGREARYTYVEIPALGGALEVSETRDQERGYSRRAVLDNVVSAVVLAALFSLLAYLLGVTLVGVPVRRLVDKARRVGEGDFQGDLPTASGDELGVLAREMNKMADRLGGAQARLEEETRAKVSAIDRLRHADRLRTVGRLASGIAHEVGTPLNVIEMRASLIAGGDVTGDEALSSARAIAAAADHITKVVQKLLLFARRQGPETTTVTLGTAIAQAISLVASMAAKRGVTLETEGELSATIPADPTLLQQAVMNLLVNAVQASERGGRVAVRVRRGDAEPPTELGASAGRFVRIEIVDGGSGIAPEHLPQLFEPFFTTKPAGEGTGLGLPIASGILRDHGGWLEVATLVGAGTTMTMFWPETPPRSASPD